MTYLAKIEQLNSADLAAYRPLILDGDPVGLIWRDNLARLRDHGLDLRDDGDRLIWYAPADFAARNAILAELAQALAAEGYVRGWRNEQLPLLANLHRPVRALIERAAAPVIGVCGYGVHVNGTTTRDGVPHMWIARRATTKSVEPGKLDQIAAGGSPYGIGVFATASAPTPSTTTIWNCRPTSVRTTATAKWTNSSACRLTKSPAWCATATPSNKTPPWSSSTTSSATAT